MEYMVVLSLSLMFVAIAVPNFVMLDASFRRSVARTQIQGDLVYIRSMALKEGGRAALIPSADGTSYTVEIGHAPYAGFPGTETEVVRKSLPSGTAIRTVGPLVFDSRGHLIDSSGNMKGASVILSWKKKDYATVSLCPVGFIQ